MKNSLFSLILCLFFLPIMAQQKTAVDSFLINPYLQWSTKNSMTVLWETTSEATTIVEYGEALPKAKEPNLSQKIELTDERLMHEVVLDNLKVETKYVYRVKSRFKSGKEIVSPVSTFKTTVNDDSAFMFAFIGDTQQNRDTPWAWKKVAERVFSERPSFVVNAGDIVDVGSIKDQWVNEFFAPGNIVMSRYPMFTVIGNHEQDDDYYYQYMANPAPEYYYKFRYGNTDFFMIDSNKDVSEGSEQYDWLEWQLAKSDATWKIVVHHHPPYSSEENDQGDTYIGASTYTTKTINLVPLYEKYGVDFCLFGHTHVYERSWPLFENRVNMKNGVVYINSGGAGGGLEDFDPNRSWFSHKVFADHHYTTFAIFDRTLVFKAIDHEGHLFDTFQLEKPEEKGITNRMLQPPPPMIDVDKMVFGDEANVSMQALEKDYAIYYTLDGNEPTQKSTEYVGPFKLKKTTELKARAYTADNRASRIVTRSLKQMDPLPAITTKTERGLNFSYYEFADDLEKLPDFSKLKAKKTGVQQTVNETECNNSKEDLWGLVLDGLVELDESRTYRFFTRSDDGSKLYIDGQLVVDNDGDHGAFWQYGDIILDKGKHALKIEYFDHHHGQMLRAGYLVDGDRRPFTPFQLSH
ncbi:MAG: metallophosphoesterase [Flavobacteriales bacterium]|nr:metallophosphoesterase [Flavobacteriales bacterium]